MIEFALLGFFALVQGAFLLWSRRSLPAALIFAALTIVVGAGAVEILSNPKPMVLEWRSAKNAKVLWYQLREGENILVMLALPNGPRFYSQPWDEQAASQLAAAGAEAEAQGGDIIMARPFEPSLAEPERLFYADPWPTPPPKTD